MPCLTEQLKHPKNENRQNHLPFYEAKWAMNADILYYMLFQIKPTHFTLYDATVEGAIVLTAAPLDISNLKGAGMLSKPL